MQWDDDRVQRELASAVRGVLKAAGCDLKSAEITYVTPPERSKAAEYRDLAMKAADRESREMWLTAARNLEGAR